MTCKIHKVWLRFHGKTPFITCKTHKIVQNSAIKLQCLDFFLHHIIVMVKRWNRILGMLLGGYRTKKGTYHNCVSTLTKASVIWSQRLHLLFWLQCRLISATWYVRADDVSYFANMSVRHDMLIKIFDRRIWHT